MLQCFVTTIGGYIIEEVVVIREGLIQCCPLGLIMYSYFTFLSNDLYQFFCTERVHWLIWAFPFKLERLWVSNNQPRYVSYIIDQVIFLG